MMIAIFIALPFLVPAAALATNSTIPPDDRDDEKCILEEDECMPFDPDKARECARMFLLSADCDIEECISEAALASCWTMECVKERLIQSCIAEEEPEYIDCNTIIECLKPNNLQSNYCAGSGYPAISVKKV